MIYGLQKILLGNFPQNFYIGSAIVNGACMQKIKIGHWAKFLARNKCFFISGSCNFTQQLTSSVVILIHSADACILVMACEDCEDCVWRFFPLSLIFMRPDSSQIIRKHLLQVYRLSLISSIFPWEKRKRVELVNWHRVVVVRNVLFCFAES